MARTLPVEYARSAGFAIDAPTYASVPYEPPQPTGWDMAAIVGLEVVPALLGGIWGGYGGGAVGGGIGNWLSQEYRIAYGLQPDLSLGELTAATAISAVPVGQLKALKKPYLRTSKAFPEMSDMRKPWMRLTAARAAQGSLLGMAELEARVLLESDGRRLASMDDLKTTALWGGVFGGTLGMIEAKFASRHTGANLEEGMNRNQAVNTLAKHIDESGGPENYAATTELFNAEQMKNISGVNSQDMAANILDMMSEVTAKVAVDDVTNLARMARAQDEAQVVGGALPEGGAAPATRMLTDSEKAFHELVTSEHVTTKQGLIDMRRYAGEKDLFFEERAKLNELNRRQRAIEHQTDHENPYREQQLKLINKARQRLVAKIEGTGPRLAKEIKKNAPIREDAPDVVRPETTRHRTVRPKSPKKVEKYEEMAERYHPGASMWGGILASGAGFAAFTKDDWDGLSNQAGLSQALMELIAGGTLGGAGARMFRKGGRWRVGRERDHKTMDSANEAMRVSAGAVKRDLPLAGTLKGVRSIDGENYIVSNFGRPMTVVNVDGTDVGFYLSSGAGGKKKTKSGQWYPITGVSPNGKWINKGKDADVAAYYGSRKLREVAEDLDDKIGDIEVLVPDVLPRVGNNRVDASVVNEWVTNHPVVNRGEKGVAAAVNSMLEDIGEPAYYVKDKTGKTTTRINPESLAPSLLVGGAGLAAWSSSDDAQGSKAGMAFTILALALGGVSMAAARRFLNGPQMKHLYQHPKARREAFKNVPKDKMSGQTAQEERMVSFVNEPYRGKSYLGTVWDDFKKHLVGAFIPLSRQLKKLSPAITRAFRDHERYVMRGISDRLGEMEPYVVSMEKAMGKNSADYNIWWRALLNGDMETLTPLMRKYNGRVKTELRKRYKSKEGAEQAHLRMRKALDDIQTYARDEGGIDVGYLENYFPRQLVDYNAFRHWMSQQKGWDDLGTDLDVALQNFADKHYEGQINLIPADEAAEVASRLMRGGSFSGTAMPSHVLERKIAAIDQAMLGHYKDPATALRDYVTSVVTAVERRKFLGGGKVDPKPVRSTVDLTTAGRGEAPRQIKDEGYLIEDLGLKMDDEEAIGGFIERHRKEYGLSQKELDVLKDVIQSRMNAKGMDTFVGFMKNMNYISILTNFGATITQLGDLAYSVHFNGLGPTGSAMFGKKNRDWYKYFGLDSTDIDMAAGRDGAAMLLIKFFNFSQFTRLDRFGKNTVMESTFLRMRKQAISPQRAQLQKLYDEINPIYGKEGAKRIIKDLRAGNLSDEVESVIWYKFLDLQPAALSEMPKYYAKGGGWRTLYMLKSFTLKQLDVFTQAGYDKIKRSHQLWKEGRKGEAMALAGEGVYGLASLAAVFALANYSTSVIKDTIYGRPINHDELREDTLWRLAGIGRYNVWQAKREGLPKAAMELFLPPITFLTRGYKDMEALMTVDTEKLGESARGLPVGDFWYWHYGPGREKTRARLAKKYQTVTY